MEYFPPGFPARLEPRVDREILKIQHKFSRHEQWQDRITAGAFAFADIACEAAENGEWRVDFANSGMVDFIDILFRNEIHINTNDLSPMQRQGLKRVITTSRKWLRFLERLTSIAENHRPSTPYSNNDNQKRQTVIQPILDKLGWSIEDWALEANVADHTARDYFNGKTNPNATTRKKLADALKITVDQLPK